jgi:hypothetical protein
MTYFVHPIISSSLTPPPNIALVLMQASTKNANELSHRSS